ncbi:unnamed protein product [Closterium sp. NIES-64]|nr:unnamed protein product [Closterium sp. NIES-64]
MTLIDTACVGQLGSLHLAALAPNVSVFNFIFQTFTFLGTATCALVARQSTPQPTSAAQSQQNLLASRAVTAAMLLAVVVGSLLALALLLSGPSLLRAMGCRPPFLLPALQYLRIRALSGASEALPATRPSWYPPSLHCSTSASMLSLVSLF